MTKLLLILASLALVACTTTPGKSPVAPPKEKTPVLKNAEVKVIWIPDRIESNRFEEGHFVHIIDKPASWSGQ